MEKEMKYTKESKPLGLPSYFKFGIELEANHVRTMGKNGLYTGESANFIKDKHWHMASKAEESLVGKGGAELVSPILQDTEEDWKDVASICEHIQKYPSKDTEKVTADEKCGLHVHFDAECLAQNPKRMQNFLRLYAESEELLYKMCNDKDNPMRKGAICKNFRGLNLVSSIWRKGMAAPSGKKILEQIETGTLKVSYKKFGRLKTIASKYKLDERRYQGLNLTNIGNPKKNTIEFRMANGTLNPEIIKQNVYLYASLMHTAIQMTEEPELYQERVATFMETNVSEKQKAENFLNLIMDSPDDRKIYLERWESVKQATVFAKNDRKGFSKNRFQREEFLKIAQKTPRDKVNQAYAYIKKQLTKTKEKEEFVYER